MMIGFGLLGLVLMLLFWGGLIFLAVGSVRVIFGNNTTTREPSPNSHQTARQILDRRYTRGEITREQYELMRQDID